MKKQVSRLSPHQNGKVVAVLLASISIIILIPFLIFVNVTLPVNARLPWSYILVAPGIYLTIGYLMIALGCVIYNFMFEYIGGIEFEVRTESA